ncbi:MAG: hypothetical protein K9M10_02590 [Candidatus Pacebacteria bacterium]|nr:hypothetical protein [Candidatus Paceibacterota bacterium]MCF7857344.1 hypothetical protein [Candidatus Paceibacterota bacterium]
MKDFLKKHLAYMQDNPEGYWFKRKLYGWGWTPATREGWGVTLLWIAVVLGDFIRIDRNSHSESDTLIAFAPHAVILIVILIVICYKKGESPKWQWGISDEDSKTHEDQSSH